MSAPKFRDGDVLSWKGHEWTIRGEGSMPATRGRWVITRADRAQSWHPEVGADLTVAGAVLLRRPVRVGDLLRLGDGAPVTFGEVEDRNFRQIGPAYLNGFTHADGTPIEPPAAEPEPEPAPREGMRRHVVYTSANVVDFAVLHDDTVQRANRLADENGRLLDENRELLADNARLRRQVERLERRGK